MTSFPSDIMKNKSTASQWIKNKLEDEGVQARNIIKYNLPIDGSAKRPSPRSVVSSYHSNPVSHLTQARVAQLCETDAGWPRTSSPTSMYTTSTSAASPLWKDEDDEQRTNRTTITTTTTTNPSTSTTSSIEFRERPKRLGVSGVRRHTTTVVNSKSTINNRTRLAEGEYRARYWGQMLDTLRRTIDEIYSACETDESEVECKEVIMILEHSKQDFHSLIEKMNLLREYERADAENKPSSLAWDERTTLPGKPIMCQVLASAAVAAANAQGSAYLSIPLNVNPECGVPRAGDNDSDLGSGTGSWHLVLPKRRLHGPATNTAAAAEQEHLTYASAVTPTNNQPLGLISSQKHTNKTPSRWSTQHTSATKTTVNMSTIHSKDEEDSSREHHPNNVDDQAEGLDDFSDIQLEVRSDLDTGESDELDADADADVEEEEETNIIATGLCKIRGSAPSNELHIGQTESATKTGITREPLVDEEDGDADEEIVEEDEDADDTTLSRDLRKIDEAIANVTTAERVLSDELDRAQYVEAALRRRLLVQDQPNLYRSGAVHHHHHRHCPISKRTAAHSDGSLLLRPLSTSRLDEFDDIAQTEFDTDADLLGVDSLLLDDEDLEEECLGNDVALEAATTASISPPISPFAVKTSIQPSKSQQIQVPTYTRKDRSDQQAVLKQSMCHQCCACQCHKSEPLLKNYYTTRLCSMHKQCNGGRNNTTTRAIQTQQNPISFSGGAGDVTNSSSLKSTVRSKLVPAFSQTASPQCNSTTAAGDPIEVASTSMSSNKMIVSTTKKDDGQNTAASAGHLSTDKFTDSVLASQVNPTGCAELVHASKQLTAALMSTPTTSSLLFVAESNVKSRVPGHGVQMHEKLSARSRRRTTNSIQELEQKQTRARILRQQHLLERAERVHELSKKVEEVHMQKRLLLHQRRSCLERRLHAAERKRQAELERRVLKAHDEETKGREIAFIQTLEAEQKQHSILTKHEESRARLHELAEERRRRLEEKLCREEAAKGRRRALEASRRARLDALQARWESRAQQLASRAELLEHSRRAAARAKEQHREVKIASLEEQQRTHIEQLRSKIQRKQEESERRHQEQLREISRKAFEMSILTHTGDESFTAAGMEPYPIPKWCRACQVTIMSEVALKSHLQGKRHQNAVLEAGQNRPLDRSDVEAFNLLHLVDAPPELLDPQSKAEQDRLKMRRKRARKLRQRMNQRGLQFVKDLEQLKLPLPDSPNRAQLQKLVKDARRFLNLPDSGPWVITRIQAMEKTLNALLRCLSGTRDSGKPHNHVTTRSEVGAVKPVTSVDQLICVSVGLLPILVNLIGLIRHQKPSSTQIVPDRTYQLACEVLHAVCSFCPEACRRMVLTNDVSILVDCLVARFSTPVISSRSFGTCTTGNNESAEVDPASGAIPSQPCTLTIMNCLTRMLSELAGDMEQTVRSSNSDNKFFSTDALCNQHRLQDLLGYIVSSGLVDLIATKLSSPRQASLLIRSSPSASTKGSMSISPVTTEQAQRFVLTSIDFLTALVRLLGCVSDPPATGVIRAPSSTTNATTARSKSFLEVNGSVSDEPLPIGDCSTAPDHPKDQRQITTQQTQVTTKRCHSTSSRDTQLGSSISSCRNYYSTDGTRNPLDPTKLLESIACTEVFGLIPLLYGLLLDPSSRPTTTTTQPLGSLPPTPVKERRSTTTATAHNTNQRSTDTNATPMQKKRNPPSVAPANVVDASPNKPEESCTFPFRSPSIGHITLQGLKLLNSLAMVNQPALQCIMNSELTGLLTRHILLSLLSRCTTAASTSIITTSASQTVALPNSFSELPSNPSTQTTVNNFPPQKQPKKGSQILNRPQMRKSTPKTRTGGDRCVDEKDGEEDEEEADDVNRLLPSGARRVVIRSSINSTTISTSKMNPVKRVSKFGLPAWAAASDIPESQSETREPIGEMQSVSKTTGSDSLNGAVLHEAILCIGHLCALHADNQNSLQRGPPPTLLHHLVALPFDYFSQRPLTDILYPTLIACCYLHASNLAVLEAELSPTLLANYIEERLLERAMNSLTDADGKQTQSDVLCDIRFHFEHRFPVSEWNAAKTYFSR